MTSPERDPEERRGQSIVHATPDLQPALAESARFPGIRPRTIELPQQIPPERLADWLGWLTLNAAVERNSPALSCATHAGETWLLRAEHRPAQTRIECARVARFSPDDLPRWMDRAGASLDESLADLRHGVVSTALCHAPGDLDAAGVMHSVGSTNTRRDWRVWPGAASIGVLSGSFFPLHHGHRALAEAAAERLERPIVFELTLANADKPPLDYVSLDRRVRQFDREEVLLTKAATFVEKSSRFPGATFLLGWDTARRVLDGRFYPDGGLESRLDRFAERGGRFLVAARREGNAIRTLSDLTLPSRYTELFIELPRERFLEEVSSTQLRDAWSRGAAGIPFPKVFLESVRGPDV